MSKYSTLEIKYDSSILNKSLIFPIITKSKDDIKSGDLILVKTPTRKLFGLVIDRQDTPLSALSLEFLRVLTYTPNTKPAKTKQEAYKFMKHYAGIGKNTIVQLLWIMKMSWNEGMRKAKELEELKT